MIKHRSRPPWEASIDYNYAIDKLELLALSAAANPLFGNENPTLSATITNVLVTGANGFIGRTLCACLSARGMHVVAAARRPMHAPFLADAQIKQLELSAAPDRWQAALRSVECVIHLAAWAHKFGPADLAALEAVNVQGSRFVAEQAVTAGVRRLILLSSVKVNGEGTKGAPYSAADIPMPENAYGISKMEAETTVRDICDRNSMECVIVRPPLVYGPGVKANFRRLMKAIQAGIPLPFGSICNKRSMVGIRNLSDFIDTCVVHPRAVGRTWLVSDGEDLSTPDLVVRIAKLMRRRPALFRFPPGCLDVFARCFGKGEEIKRLTGSLQVDITPAFAQLSWRPGISVDEELAETVSSFGMEQG